MAKRYAIIDHCSGFVWGVTDAETAVEACRAIDAELGEYGRQYVEDFRPDFANESGYHVYEVPAGFDVFDGQSADEIAAVEAFKRVAYVRLELEQD